MPRFALRREDIRNLFVGFFSLATVMFAHTLMETARDSLFLARLPATQLPWAYLAIAVLAVVELKFLNWLLGYINDRRWLLTATLIYGATVTFGFWLFIDSVGDRGLVALYVWTGLLITILLVQFWLILSESVTITQAKRIFAPIAAGGVVGAMLGSFVAERVLQNASPQELLLIASLSFLFAAITPFLWARKDQPATIAPKTEREFKLPALLKNTYFTQLLTVIFIGTLTLTVLDYVFKSIVAENIAPEKLGVFFARLHLFLNALALVAQLLVAGWMLRVIGAHRSAGVLPLVVIGGSIAMAVGLGHILLAAVALKALDGSLRHSLYKTSVEVLYLPLGEGVRPRAKAVIESVGHRGAQAFASLLILLTVSLGLEVRTLAWLLAVPATLWLLAIYLVQDGYRELFRARLKQGAIETRVELQEIDLRSLEALLLALNSDEDEEVLSAIDMFDRHNRVELLPVLILYHPSQEVKLRALESFANAADPRFVTVARRLTRQEHCEVEAAALRAITAVAPDVELLRKARSSERPIVQATALIGLLSLRQDASLRADLEKWVSEGSSETLTALARAIEHQQQTGFAPTLLRLLSNTDVNVKLATLRAMRAHPDRRFLEAVTDTLGTAALRSAARAVFVAVGSDALPYLDSKMGDTTLPRAIRRHLPRTVSRFYSVDAARILLKHLEAETDATVSYKILRGLGRLQANVTGLRLDKSQLHALLERALVRTVQLVEWRTVCERADNPGTMSRELLATTLREKETSALERVFRILGLLHPKEDFALVWRGAQSDNPKNHAASREVLEETLSGRFREAVLALTDTLSPEVRAQNAARALGIKLSHPDYADALRSMLRDPSMAVQCIATREIAELKLDKLTGELEDTKPASGPVRDAIERALKALETPEGATHVA